MGEGQVKVCNAEAKFFSAAFGQRHVRIRVVYGCVLVKFWG